MLIFSYFYVPLILCSLVCCSTAPDFRDNWCWEIKKSRREADYTGSPWKQIKRYENSPQKCVRPGSQEEGRLRPTEAAGGGGAWGPEARGSQRVASRLSVWGRQTSGRVAEDCLPRVCSLGRRRGLWSAQERPPGWRRLGILSACSRMPLPRPLRKQVLTEKWAPSLRIRMRTRNLSEP